MLLQQLSPYIRVALEDIINIDVSPATGRIQIIGWLTWFIIAG
jgi:hypothetical protein